MPKSVKSPPSSGPMIRRRNARITTSKKLPAEQAIATRTRLNAFRRTQLREGDRIIRSRDEHDDVLSAMAQGDGEAAARRMRAHMLNAATALGHYISSHSAAVANNAYDSSDSNKGTLPNS